MRKSHFCPDPAALLEAARSGGPPAQRTRRRFPAAEYAPPRVCPRTACARTTAWGRGTGTGLPTEERPVDKELVGAPTHQEPVEVHEGEQQKERIEEEVEGDVRH